MQKVDVSLIFVFLGGFKGDQISKDNGWVNSKALDRLKEFLLKTRDLGSSRGSDSCFAGGLHLPGPQLPQLQNGSESIFPVGRLWGVLANSTLAHGYGGHDCPVVLMGWAVSCHAGKEKLFWGVVGWPVGCWGRGVERQGKCHRFHRKPTWL